MALPNNPSDNTENDENIKPQRKAHTLAASSSNRYTPAHDAATTNVTTKPTEQPLNDDCVIVKGDSDTEENDSIDTGEQSSSVHPINTKKIESLLKINKT